MWPLPLCGRPLVWDTIFPAHLLIQCRQCKMCPLLNEDSLPLWTLFARPFGVLISEPSLYISERRQKTGHLHSGSTIYAELSIRLCLLCGTEASVSLRICCTYHKQSRSSALSCSVSDSDNAGSYHTLFTKMTGSTIQH